MKVSQVEIKLSSEDLLSIINDVVKINGLIINELNINKDIEIRGVFKKVLSLGFKVNTRIIGVYENKLTLKLISASLMSIGILKFLRKLALKIALKGFKEQGIMVKSDEIIIDIDKILNKVPFLNFNIYGVWVNNGDIKVDLRNINFSLNNMQLKEPSLQIAVKEEEVEVESTEDYIMHIEVNKVDDAYTHSREYVEEKLPQEIKPYKDYILFIPDIFALILRLFKDKRVSKKIKIMMGICVGYISIPFDILPDKLPIIGSLDDITILFFLLNRIINDVPMEVILENWQGKNELVVVLKNTIDFLIGFTGAKNVETIYEVIDTITTV
ncbi:YkvA family protein [Clostridium tarantellae]|uniref:DUF1232 domain-containing protein n=1 Tax=Clostridium tarantellae TaxID=39493 RepID=A0A6I1MM24_9CLOT|nr:DUF1232 domain-containing protein [Clostridium tarantellae]